METTTTEKHRTPCTARANFTIKRSLHKTIPSSTKQFQKEQEWKGDLAKFT